MTDAPCMRVADLARRWACSQSHVRAILTHGDIPHLRLGHMVRVAVAEVIAYEARCQTAKPRLCRVAGRPQWHIRHRGRRVSTGCTDRAEAGRVGRHA